MALTFKGRPCPVCEHRIWKREERRIYKPEKYGVADIKEKVEIIICMNCKHTEEIG